MRQIILFPITLILMSSAAASTAAPRSADMPAKGEWDFAPRLLWEVDQVNGGEFEIPAELRISEDGTFYFHDFRKHASYIFDSEGGYLRTFGTPGDGPGEVPRYQNCFTAGSRVVIASPGSLHFYERDGRFVSSVSNNNFECFPLAFLNDKQFLCGPGELNSLAGKTARIVQRDLATGQEETFTEISVAGADPSAPRGPAVVIRGLTPVIEVGYDAAAGRIYYGKSDEYVIHVADTTGSELLTFGLLRDRIPVSEEAKRMHFASSGLPPERIDPLIANLPGALTCFRRIQVNNGLVYVFATTTISRQPDRVQIDIFSRDGTYLFRSEIGFPDGHHIFSSADHVAIMKDRMYAILEDDDGRKTVAGYQLRLPSPPTGTRHGDS